MKIDSDHFTNIKMIFDNLGSKISVVLELGAIHGCDTSYKSNDEKVHVRKNVCKDPSLTFTKMLVLNINLDWKIVKKTTRYLFKFKCITES